jgi:hypothetical protein
MLARPRERPGDGTLTILVMATGNETVYTPDGKALYRNPGQIRFEILIDHGRTPTNPSDDEFLEFLGLVKGSTGGTSSPSSATTSTSSSADNRRPYKPTATPCGVSHSRRRNAGLSTSAARTRAASAAARSPSLPRWA